MNMPLVNALKELNLEPGQSQQVSVNGYQIEIRRLKDEEKSDFADAVMLNLWLDIPPSPAARTITVTRGEPMLPTPFIIDESDLAPE